MHFIEGERGGSGKGLGFGVSVSGLEFQVSGFGFGFLSLGVSGGGHLFTEVAEHARVVQFAPLHQHVDGVGVLDPPKHTQVPLESHKVFPFSSFQFHQGLSHVDGPYRLSLHTPMIRNLNRKAYSVNRRP